MLLPLRIALVLHLLAAVVWIGGMFFSLLALRPVALRFEPPVRLLLMSGVMERFFKWVWVSVTLLVLTGYGAVWALRPATGFSLSALPWPVVGMLTVGNTMFAIFLYAYFGPYRKMRDQETPPPQVAASLDRIRKLISVNLALGMALVIIGSLGRV